MDEYAFFYFGENDMSGSSLSTLGCPKCVQNQFYPTVRATQATDNTRDIAKDSIQCKYATGAATSVQATTDRFVNCGIRTFTIDHT
ncbi:hypothetical protein BGZ82_008292 [Podila clonocystis]|nr:hypothetical protein BGZ82_008292 [Podila clonocystis]